MMMTRIRSLDSTYLHARRALLLLLLLLAIQYVHVQSASLSAKANSSTSTQSILHRYGSNLGPIDGGEVGSNLGSCKDHEDVVKKFQSFFHSKLHSPVQTMKRKMAHFQTNINANANRINIANNNAIHLKPNHANGGVGGGNIDQSQHSRNTHRHACNGFTSFTRGCRTKFTFKLPPSRHALWLNMFHTMSNKLKSNIHSRGFLISSSPSSSSKLQFNNDQVGLTYPQSQQSQRQQVQQVNLQPTEGTTNIDGSESEDQWFPMTKDQQSSLSNDGKHKHRNEWKVIRFTKQIGHGKECYDIVKDTILNWEFHDDNKTDHNHHHSNQNHDVGERESQQQQPIIPKTSNYGILRVFPPALKLRQQQQQPRSRDYLNPLLKQESLTQHSILSPNSSRSKSGRSDRHIEFASSTSSSLPYSYEPPTTLFNDMKEENCNPNILPIWSSSTSSSTSTIRTENNNANINLPAFGRKLITYTKKQILPFLPSLYVLNPVCVVYDIIDEKVHDSAVNLNCFGNGDARHDHNNDSIMTVRTVNNDKNKNNNSSSSKKKINTELTKTASSQNNIMHNKRKQRSHSAIYTSTAYGTLEGHLLVGEERVTVVMQDIDDGIDSMGITRTGMTKGISQISNASKNDSYNDDKNRPVHVEIISYSKPSSLLGRIVFPFIGKMQNDFFQKELEHIQHCYDRERRRKQ